MISYFAAKLDIAIYLVERGADAFYKDNNNTDVLVFSINKGDFNFFRSCLEIINSNDECDEGALKDLYLQLTKEEESDALVLLFEISPILNKEVN